MIFSFKPEVRDLISRLKKFGLWSTVIELESKFQTKLNVSEREVLSVPATEPPAPVSQKDVQRSEEVAALYNHTDPDLVKSQIEKVAAEYEGVRANYQSGSVRTRQMTAVMAKMRTLGRAAYPYRHELIASESPGKRLMAVASLQMSPDYQLIDWLASTTKTEAPFLQYQALTALLIAVRNAGPQMKLPLIKAAAVAKSALSSEDRDVSRWNLLENIEQEIGRIPDIVGS